MFLGFNISEGHRGQIDLSPIIMLLCFANSYQTIQNTMLKKYKIHNKEHIPLSITIYRLLLNGNGIPQSPEHIWNTGTQVVSQ